MKMRYDKHMYRCDECRGIYPLEADGVKNYAQGGETEHFCFRCWSAMAKLPPEESREAAAWVEASKWQNVAAVGLASSVALFAILIAVLAMLWK